jgi:hypothetical protein
VGRVCEHTFVTSQGSLRHQFQRALERGSVLDAVAAARAMGTLSLGDALALCVVMAERDRARYDRAAVRWLSRYLAEAPDASLAEAHVLAGALSALPAAPRVALPMLRGFVRVRNLVTVRSVFDDAVVVS